MKIPRILGVGTDIQSVERIQKLVQRGDYFEKRFITGVFHPYEIE
jgi:phosphopantetheinyl transferase (holo-ACP synthase)